MENRDLIITIIGVGIFFLLLIIFSVVLEIRNLKGFKCDKANDWRTEASVFQREHS